MASYEYGSEHPVFDSTSDCRGQKFTDGWRGYLIYAPEDEKSWMSIMDKDENFHTLMDKSGYVSLFYLPGEGENCWHAIVSETHRWSIGFRIEEEYFEKELLPALQANGADIEDMPLSLNRRRGGGAPPRRGAGRSAAGPGAPRKALGPAARPRGTNTRRSSTDARIRSAPGV